MVSLAVIGGVSARPQQITQVQGDSLFRVTYLGWQSVQCLIEHFQRQIINWDPIKLRQTPKLVWTSDKKNVLRPEDMLTWDCFSGSPSHPLQHCKRYWQHCPLHWSAGRQQCPGGSQCCLWHCCRWSQPCSQHCQHCLRLHRRQYQLRPRDHQHSHWLRSQQHQERPQQHHQIRQQCSRSSCQDSRSGGQPRHWSHQHCQHRPLHCLQSNQQCSESRSHWSHQDPHHLHQLCWLRCHRRNWLRQSCPRQPGASSSHSVQCWNIRHQNCGQWWSQHDHQSPQQCHSVRWNNSQVATIISNTSAKDTLNDSYDPEVVEADQNLITIWSDSLRTDKCQHLQDWGGAGWWRSKVCSGQWQQSAPDWSQHHGRRRQSSPGHSSAPLHHGRRRCPDSERHVLTCVPGEARGGKPSEKLPIFETFLK